MTTIILSTAIGLLFLFIVLSHKLLSKRIEKKFERQNQRLAAGRKRDLKMLEKLKKLESEVILNGR